LLFVDFIGARGRVYHLRYAAEPASPQHIISISLYQKKLNIQRVTKIAQREPLPNSENSPDFFYDFFGTGLKIINRIREYLQLGFRKSSTGSQKIFKGIGSKKYR
jgi:hypothetical protein